MRKNLLFVMNNLTCGGAEKALISLLETIDYSKYNVDLFLFKHEGLFLEKIPKEVNLLDEPIEYKYFDMRIKEAILKSLKNRRFDIVFSRIIAGYIFRTEENKSRSEQKVWRYLSNSLRNITKEYDVAIGYLEKNPIYFCIDNVKANKKIGFIHTDYEKSGMDPKIDENKFKRLDYIATVSEESVIGLQRVFPMLKEKVVLINNTILPNIIKTMAQDRIKIDKKQITICSVGRLHYSKGFEMAIEACEILVKDGYNVKWYVVGEGEERKKLEKLIIDKNLEERFILLGLKGNPYPYIRMCNIYVQTSLFEGRCLAVTEAKILQKPIVVTNFSAAKDQIRENENGIICRINSKSISEGVKLLIDNPQLKNNLVTNLSKEIIETNWKSNKLFELIEK